MKKPLIAVSVIVLTTLLFVGCCLAPVHEDLKGPRPVSWAQPMKHLVLSNLNQIAPDFYRGAQPDAAGMEALEKMGIKTVINLRDNHDDDDEVKGTNLKTILIPIKTWALGDEHVIPFLKAINDKEKRPVFLHCAHGSDRTGTMCAVYRIVFQGWTKKEAIREMKWGGYDFHTWWDNLPEYIENMDVEKLKAEAGIK
jgi:protein tyrosine phosphatase (PTP) superfamily phosphohydrolase (DUF442 family)